ncbi:MAG: hypothetical protein ACLR0V_02010 [Roseburia hominis]
MEKIYIAFVDTPGLFASALHGYLKQKYIHVLLSLDENLDEAYSFGRRNPAVPLVAGYEREDKERILRSFPDADYMIGAIDCTAGAEGTDQGKKCGFGMSIGGGITMR